MEILLAEDGKVNQLVAVRLLERRGHNVSVVENGQEALHAVESGKYDLVLMDIQMPIMSGYEASRAIREKEEDGRDPIPIVAMTAHAMPGDREECLEAGMDDYVSKPIESDELYEVVERYAPSPESDEMPSINATLAMATEHYRHREQGDTETFDPVALHERYGDVSLMCELIKIFESDAQGMLNELHEAERVGDARELHEASHRMKGLIGNYCAQRAFELVTALDNEARAEELDEVGDLVTELDEEMSRLHAALRDYRLELEKKLQLS